MSPVATRRAPATARPPTRTVERSLLRAGHALVGGMDEVGRGALAGPVTVGVVVVDAATRTAPRGLRDSKLLAPAAREALCAPVRRWCVASAVGHASPAEIDSWGIIAALRAAGRRALAELRRAGAWPSAVILDGAHDWLAAPLQTGLFEATDDDEPAPAVHLRVKADLTCSAVAAASVLAKCERDSIMTGLAAEHPGYGWAVNKGYAVPEHVAALRSRGPCDQHRRSWRLPGPGTEESVVGTPGSEDAIAEEVVAAGILDELELIEAASPAASDEARAVRGMMGP